MKRAPLSLSLILALPFAASAENLSPGLYEYNGTVMMEGMPGNQPTAFSGSQCMTAQDLADGGQKALTSGSGGGNPCTFSNYQSSDSSATWNMSCQSQGFTMNGGGSASFNRGGYNVRSENYSQMMGMKVKTITTLQGRRTGDCTQSTMGTPASTAAPSYAAQPVAVAPYSTASSQPFTAADGRSAVALGAQSAVWAAGLGGIDPRTLQVVMQAQELYGKVSPYVGQAQTAMNAASNVGPRAAALKSKLRADAQGAFVLPYRSDGQPAEWATKALQAAATGALTSVAADKATEYAASAAGSAASSIPFLGPIINLFTGAAKESVKSTAQDAGAAMALGGWDSIRAGSNQSFDTLDDMLVYTTTSYASADSNYLYALAATLALYPEAKDRFEPALKAHFGVQ